jgi:hypothetical protein
LENRWGKLEKLELEILKTSPYRTLENKAGSSPAELGTALPQLVYYNVTAILGYLKFIFLRLGGDVIYWCVKSK